MDKTKNDKQIYKLKSNLNFFMEAHLILKERLLKSEEKNKLLKDENEKLKQHLSKKQK